MLLTPSPTPSPSPPQEVVAQSPLSDEINAATRKQHLELNRLIIAQLPLALPPYTTSSALLGQGLALFAQIFFTFEAVWDELEPSKKTHIHKIGDTDSFHRDEIVSSLRTLRPPGLLRSPRLRDDLEYIQLLTGIKRLDQVDTMLQSELRTLVQDKPQFLFAYAWVMYLAIFSGGRWIRQQLANAGPGFWSGQGEYLQAIEADKDLLLDLPGYTFLSFNSQADGEDIKADFKLRLSKAELLLNRQERRDVVEAAQQLFEHCIVLVAKLDEQAKATSRSRSLPLLATCIVGALAILVWRWTGLGLLRD